jgi:hypothetical protein
MELDYTIVRDPLTGVYGQVPVKSVEVEDPVDDISHAIKMDVQPVKNVLKLKQN